MSARRRPRPSRIWDLMYLAHLERPGGTKPEPLYFLGSLAGRRYTPRGGPAGLYLAFDPSTPPAELRAVVFEHGFPVSSQEHDPIVTIAVRSVVHHVLNLMDPVTVTTLELRDADLKADWEGGQAEYLAGTAPMPATQLLALAAHESGLCAGIKYPSARTDFGVNLVVFPDRLDAGRGDRLEVVDSAGRFTQCLPP